MKKLRTIVETPRDADHSPDTLDETPPRPLHPKYEKEKFIGGNHFGKGSYNISARGSKGGKHPWQYHAVSDQDEVHMEVRGGTTHDKHLIANETRKHPDSEINAPDFYKSILHHGIHKGIQSGETQSEGGKNIWHRLAHDHPDVEVSHHDKASDQKIKLHTGDDWDKNFNQEKPTVFRMKLKK